MKPHVLLIVLPYLQLSQESKAGYWGKKYAEKVSPSTKMKSWPALPYGCLSVATYCKDVADIKIIDCNVMENYRDAIISEVKKSQPGIVGFSMTFDNSYSHLQGILEDVRKISKEIMTVIGGAATTAVCLELLQRQPLLDAVCFGDGEIPFRELCENKYFWTFLYRHPSWVTRMSLVEGRVPVKTVVENLDDIIELDYGFVNPDDYAMREEFSPFAEEIKDQRRFFIVTSKNCPYRCAFCYRSLSIDPADRKMRYASVEKVIEHIRFLVKHYRMNVLTICDDQFLVNMKRAKEIFRQLAQLDIRVECLQGTSVAFIDTEMATLMYAAGMRRVVLPIESGSQEVLDMMVEKPIDLGKAKETIQVLRAAGLWVTAVFVMGFPGEEERHRKETLDWIREADLDWCTFSAAIPIKGTKLWDICVKKGYVDPNIGIGEIDYGNYSIELPDKEKVARDIYKMNLDVNFVNNRSMKNGDYGTAAEAFKQVIKMYEGHAFAWYYLCQCLLKLGDPVEAYKANEMFLRSILNDHKWAEYAAEFKIGE